MTTSSDSTQSGHEQYRQRYLEGHIAWADHEPPPEIIALCASLNPGRALDLGCGYGRASIYLATNGWVADGIDFVAEAIAVAQDRALKAGVERATRFYTGFVTDLSFLTGPYDLAVDIGCVHSFEEPERRAYYAELNRLLRSGGNYLLFARLREDGEPVGDGPPGINEVIIRDLFATDFDLEHVELGTTKVADSPPWKSGWFWFCRH